MPVDIADFDFLEPAHVFVRPDGREARFLFLTNTALPAKFKKDFPPQVVYADENDNVLSCSIERFLANRKFTHVDPELEARLLNLLALGGSSNVGDEDSLDLDDELLVTSDDSEEESEEHEFEAELPDDSAVNIGTDVTEIDPTDPRDDLPEDSTPIVTFVAQDERPAAIDPLYLAQAVSSYQETPNLTDGSVQHVLFIRAAPGITKEKLYHSFSPTADNINTVFTFKVVLEGNEVLIDWDNFAGVYSCIFYETEMYQVIFTITAASRAAAIVAAREAEAPVPDLANAVSHTPAVVVANPASVVAAAAPAVAVQAQPAVAVHAAPAVAAVPTVAVAPVATVQPQPTVVVAAAPAVTAAQ